MTSDIDLINNALKDLTFRLMDKYPELKKKGVNPDEVVQYFYREYHHMKNDAFCNRILPMIVGICLCEYHINNQTNQTQTKEIEIKEKPRPLPPQNGYVLFAKTFHKAHPEIKRKIFNHIGQAWMNLSDSAKAEWTAKAKDKNTHLLKDNDIIEKVQIPQIRKPVTGDMIASRSSQKAIVGLMLPEEQSINKIRINKPKKTPN
jgi:hypothetical protein